MYAPTNNHGYVALVTAIFVAASLLVFVIAVNFEGYFSRFTVVESDQKERASFLAEACLETTRLRIAKDIDYNDPDPVNVGGRTCDIVSVTTHGLYTDWRIVEVQGTDGGAVTNLRAVLDADSLPTVRIDSWEEVGSF